MGASQSLLTCSSLPRASRLPRASSLPRAGTFQDAWLRDLSRDQPCSDGTIIEAARQCCFDAAVKEISDVLTLSKPYPLASHIRAQAADEAIKHAIRFSVIKNHH